MLWCSDGPPTAELIRQLRSAHPVSELWPLLVEDDPHAHDAALVLVGFWHSHTRGGPGSTTSPYGQRWPRTARPACRWTTPDDCADPLTRDLLRDDPRCQRLGLVPAPRGADALSVMGWTEPLNHDDDTAHRSFVRWAGVAS